MSSVGIIIFVIGIIYTLIESATEKNKKKAEQQSTKPIVPKQDAPRKLTEANSRPSVLDRLKEELVKTSLEIQDSFEEAKKDIQPKKVTREVKKRVERQSKQKSHLEVMTDEVKNEIKHQKQHLKDPIHDYDLTEEPNILFNEENIVKGIIMSEILAKPKARR